MNLFQRIIQPEKKLPTRAWLINPVNQSATEVDSLNLASLIVSAISQNQPGIIEIKGLKTSHFQERKTAPLDRGEIGSMGHVECPQSEPANNDLQPGRAWMVAATNCERVGDQSRNGTPVSAAGKTGHFDHRL